MYSDWRPILNDAYLNNTHPRGFTPVAKESSPSPAKKSTNVRRKSDPEGLDWLAVTFAVSLVFTLQAVLAVGSYSGEGKPPMHGDFEAQRHWMEVTYHLPISQWYVNGTDNDLLYWGLDYPPLTAYHSWLMGAIADRIDPSWVALHSSRGIESSGSKVFMRITAALPFYFILLPAAAVFSKISKCNRFSQTTVFSAVFGFAGLIAMDCAHFQYNSISLGLFLAAYIDLVGGFTLTGSIFFCLSVNYKQMELYHALPIFVFILARSLKRPLFSRISESLYSLIQVALVVLVVFSVLWAPFLLEGVDSVKTALARIFPFYRGLYEDKVASFWCAFSFVLKLNKIMDHTNLLRLCTGCVLVTSLPSLGLLFFRPTLKNFRYSLFLTSLAFFLFSFQVHEKSILLPVMAALLLLPDFPTEIGWFLHISNTSLFSLCVKDGTETVLFLFMAYYIFCAASLPSFDSKILNSIHHLSCLSAVSICLLEWFLSPPPSLPHLFPLLNAFFSCCHFLLFLAYFYLRMFSEEWHKTAKKSV